MNTIYGLRHLKRQAKGSVVTIGVFDGVHIGHRKVIKKAVDSAVKAKLASIVITFDPHPAKILKSGRAAPSLISLKHRIRLIGELGADILLIVKFTKPFSKMPPEKFVENILIDKLRMKEIYLGDNFSFGNGAAGRGARILRDMSRGLGFKVTIIKPVKLNARIVSSSLIRRLILSGNLREAARLSGRPVSIFGTVVKGSGIARGLGCPTANINPHHEAIPPKGVYAVRARIGGKQFPGIVNIGFRPTFYSPRDKEPTVEAHIFDFRGNLYNRDIEVEFASKIRDERKFRSSAALIRQIARDMGAAIKILYKIT
ncbi:MAG: bifunctional riboflavin kinase/FAD synthetase [Candidatus Omnitrophota bacterium]|nr:bifunctional riboflavin kinase/FAD synthetase [Candidatus Omnitrophota bacterium]